MAWFSLVDGDKVRFQAEADSRRKAMPIIRAFLWKTRDTLKQGKVVPWAGREPWTENANAWIDERDIRAAMEYRKE